MERVDVEQWKGREVARLLALVETERRYYQEIVASLPVGLAVVTHEGAIQSANRAFRQICRLKAEDVHRRTIDQIIPSPELARTIHDMPASGGSAGLFRVFVNGSDLRISTIPVRDWDDESDIEVLLVLEDVTGVAPSAQPVDSPALMWTANPDTMEFTAVAGEASGAVHPGFASSPVHPDDRERVLEYYKTSLATAGRYACEYRAIKGENEIQWYRDAFTVFDMPARKAAGVVTEITQRRQVELMHRQAARLDALTSLSRTLSHDLNNPLMIVTGYGEDLLNSFNEADARRGDMQEILTAADRIAGISTQLLDFTRKQANAPQPVNVAEAVARALGADNLETSVPPHLRALADPDQLTEAVGAVLTKLRETGSVSIGARPMVINEHTAEDGAGNYVDIVFGSSTCCISFDSLIPGKDPNGPPLARAHLLAREWGGGVWQSPGEVHLVIPAAEPEKVEPPPAPEPAPEEPIVATEPVVTEPPPAPTAPPAETILVVEDEGGIRALVRKILRRQSYEVLEAGSAEEALALLAARPTSINLLITDMTLPGRNGRQLAEQIKTTQPNLLTMYISGYTDDPAVYDRDNLPAGAVFLQKPFTLGSLVKKVREVLDSAK